MRPKKRGKPESSALEKRLAELEAQAAERGIRVHYDRLEAAGLKLRGGICSLRGDRHLFIDKRKSTADKINLIKDHIGVSIPGNTP